MHKNIDNIIGKKFDYLRVIDYSHTNKNRAAIWKCQCDCGNTILINGTTLRSKKRKHSCGCKLRLAGNLAAIKSSMVHYITRAKVRTGEAFQLTIEQFVKITKQNCSYCDVIAEKSNCAKSRTGVFFYNGLDRKDNSKGYTIENCVSCCQVCNSIKGKYLTHEQMLKMMSTLKVPGIDIWEQFRKKHDVR